MRQSYCSVCRRPLANNNLICPCLTNREEFTQGVIANGRIQHIMTLEEKYNKLNLKYKRLQKTVKSLKKKNKGCNGCSYPLGRSSFYNY